MTRSRLSLWSLWSVGLLALAASATAATISVQNGAVGAGADGICSLVEAIENANGGGQDHLDCPPGSAGEDTVRLHLNGAYSFDAGTAEVPITSALVIQGQGATLTHDAGGFFDIPSSGFLKLRDLTVSGSEGAGLSAIASSGSLLIDGCTFEENVNQAGDGGAIRVSWGSESNKSVEIRDSVFRNNVSSDGGGAISVSVTGTTSTTNLAFLLEDVTLQENGQWISAPGIQTTSGGGLFLETNGLNSVLSAGILSSRFISNVANIGGGLYVFGNDVDLTIDRTTIEGNNALEGGGMFNRRAEVTVVRSLISGNDADSLASDSSGGGFANSGGEMTITNSTFSGNIADEGGALYNQARNAVDAIPAFLTLQFVTITDNEARDSSSGGGILNEQEGVVEARVSLQNTLILGNTSPLSNSDCRNDGGIMDSLGYNVKSGSALAGCSYTGAGTGTDVSATGAASGEVDPALADNGGPTMTHAIPVGSEARNLIPGGASSCDADQVDQRYLFRNSNNATASCDAGAYEYGAGCPNDLILENQTLAGPITLFQALSSVTLGSNLTIVGIGIEVNAPTVSFEGPTEVEGPLTIGHTTDCP